MNSNRQLAVNMIAQILGFAVNLGVGFFLTPFIVKTIGREAYGFVGLANNFISYAQIITLALNSMAGRFITISYHQDNPESVNRYFTSIILANGVISLLLTFPSVIILFSLNSFLNISNNIMMDVTILWALLFLSFLININGSVFEAAIFANNRLDLSSKRDILSNILKSAILIIAYSCFIPSVWYIGISTLICSIFVSAVNIYFTKKLIPYFEIKKNYFDIHKIRILIASGVWNSITQLSSIMSNGLNLLMVNVFIGASSMGSLSIAKVIPTMILSIFAMLAGVFSPQLTLSYAKKDYKSMKNQLLTSVKILGVFSCVPISILLAYGDVFYKLWMPSENSNLLQILAILSCFEFIFVLPLESIWNIFTVTNKVKLVSIFLFVSSIISILVLFTTLNFVHDKTIGLYVITGTSTVFSVIRALTFLPLFGAYCLNLKLTTFYPVIFRNTVGVVIITTISIIYRNIFVIDNWVKFLIASIVTTIFSLILNSVVVLGRHERKVLVGIIKEKIKLMGVN